MRLIDADALADNIAVLFERNQELIYEWLMNQIEDAIDEAPTIEVALIVGGSLIVGESMEGEETEVNDEL